MDEIDEGKKLIFQRGTDVGVLARELFPNGIIATEDPRQYSESISRTTRLIEESVPVIYEAAFSFNEVLVIADIIVKDKNRWHIYEVKSSTSVSETYELDASLQYYVISNILPGVKDVSIVFINNKYVRQGPLEPKKLFTIQSVTDKAIENQEHIRNEVVRLKNVLKEKTIPVKDIGPHCSAPYDCSFLGYCWKHVPGYSVFDIGGLRSEKKFDLYNQGVLLIEDVPVDYSLSAQQQIQVDCHKEKRIVIDLDKISEFLSVIKYPLYYMDFESIMPAVPIFDNARPYQQITFQYSLHCQQKRGSAARHFAFLAEASGDPRKDFIENLMKDTKGKGTILVYNKTFEITRLKELAIDFPAYKEEIEERISWIVDLMDLFRKKHYYTPDMKGSYSIKAVLPALVPALSYDEMEISDGGTASSAFESLYYEKEETKIKEIRNSLLEYCKLDTLAMVEIMNILTQTG